MRTKLKFQFVTAAVVASLAFSLLHTTAVVADDETPPPAETPVEVPVENPIENPEIAAPLLEQLPRETEVVVVVEGEIQPLATQSAANAFVVGDPIWCPEGDAPTPGAGDCTASYSNLLALVEAIDDGSLVLPARAGVIWITSGGDSSSADISIDGSNPRFSTLSNYALTIQGGWDGVSGDSSATGTSVFSVPLSITNWNAAVTINQITLNTSTYATPSIGLEVQTSGDVFLDSISTLENGDVGLAVEAGGDIEAGNLTSQNNAASGAEFFALGGVTLFGANNFLNNQGDGLVVEAAGDIDLENVTAQGNHLSGADLTSTAGDVTLSGVNSFNLNLDTGLSVEAAGDIDLENAAANQNGGSGAVLYSSGGGIALSGVNAFDQNAGNGLLAEASADVDIDGASFSASANGGSGASLVSLSQSVSLTGSSNVFSNNALEGLFIEAFSDATLENITANDNASGAEITLGGSLLMTGTNVFNNNRGVGLYADAGGEIDVENITANQNGLISGFGGGAELYALGAVFLGGGSAFNENQDSGLVIDAGGNVEAQNVNASGNGASGAEVLTHGSFVLSGTNVFNNNAQDGLFVDAGGFVSIENITARFNGGDGVFIEGGGNAVVTCGLTTDNAVYQIEADLPGTLTLAGVDFGGDIDHHLGVDEDHLRLVSNGCFVYPVVIDDEEDDGDDEDGLIDLGVTLLPEPLLPIQVVNADDGQAARLDCRLYRGTLLKTPSGNAYIPCPIDDAARLLAIPPYGLPGVLPEGAQYLSSLHLAITKDGVMYKPPAVPGSVWYVDASAKLRNFGNQVIYWDGSDWNDITEEVTPLISIFFPVPPELQGKNLAILYWDGTGWVELADGQFFGDGRVTHAGGFMDNGYFTAIVNFVGTFVLVEK